MQLFITHASPFARKVRVVIEEIGAASEVTIEPITEVTIPTNRIAQLSAASPLGKVPALLTDDGVIVDSVAIAEYLDTRFAGGLFPAGDARWPALTLHSVADGIVEAGIAVRLEGLRPEDKRWPAWIDAHRRKIAEALNWAEDAANLEAQVDIGQIALACAIDWLDFRQVIAEPLAGRPRIAAWHREISKRASLVATMPSA